MCDRAVIINQGKIVSDSSIHDLVTSGTGKKMIRIEFSEPADPELFKNLPGIEKLETQEGNLIRITFNRDIDARAEIFRIAAEHNLPVVGLTQEELSIENIFRDLTNFPEEKK